MMMRSGFWLWIAVVWFAASVTLYAQAPAAPAAAQPAVAPSASTAPGHYDITLAGAVAGGQADCTAAIQAELNRAAKNGGTVRVPAGVYAVKGTLTIPANVTLEGETAFVNTLRRSGKPITEMKGSILLAYAGRGQEKGTPFVTLDGDNSAIKGVTIFYPESDKTTVPPVPYPPCIASREHMENVAVIDCLLVNPYTGLRFKNTHRFFVRNVMGYPIRLGLYVDFCADISRIENVHFWPFDTDYKPENPYCQWINLNGVAFEFGRTDWQYVRDTFCFGYGIGYHFIDEGTGGCNGSFTTIGADCCRRALVADQIQPYGLQIVNGEFVGRWAGQDAVAVDINAKAEGKISLVNCNFWGPLDRAIWMKAPKSQVTAIGCNFNQWDVAKKGSPAVQLDQGKAIVQGSTFGEGKLHIAVAKDVKSAIISGNQAEGGVAIENHAGDKTQQSLNEKR
jgi:hypothetical protein